jgi:signal transduction histidine kinase
MQLPPWISRDPTIVPTLDDIHITLQTQLEEIRSLALAQDWVAIRRRVDTQIRPLEFLSSDLVAKVDHEVGMEEAQSIEETRTAELRVFYQTNWFLILSAALFLALLWLTNQWRIWELNRQFETTLEARVGERTRIARELHDTLLQSFQGLLLRFQIVSELLPKRPVEAKEQLDRAMDGAAKAITEGRDAVQGLRTSTVQTNDLAKSINTLGEELAADPANDGSPSFRVAVEGESRDLHPILRDEIYRIAGESLRNAFRHAHAQHIEVEFRYDDEQFRLRVRDDGKGLDGAILSGQGPVGHYGLSGMRERAKLIGGKLVIWSQIDGGTEVELRIPSGNAYVLVAKRSWISELLARK